MRNKSHLCFWFVVLSTFVLCSCSFLSKPKGEKILADEVFFKKEIVPLYANGKAATLKKLQETFNEKTLAKGTDITVSDGFTISVPQDLQPVIGNIVGKYGKPDKIERNVYYYGDVGLQTQNGKSDDKVSSIVVVCSIHAKGPSL